VERDKRGKTKVWQYYEAGRTYNNGLSPNQYDLVNTNIEFFAGNQWLHLPESPAMSRLPKPMFNIIKRVTSLFVASLTSSATTVAFEPLAYYDGNNEADPDSDAASFATANIPSGFLQLSMLCSTSAPHRKYSSVSGSDSFTAASVTYV
jgi:hypothetical protein